MEAIDLKKAAELFFAFRPDEAYSFDEFYQHLQAWETKAYSCKRGEVCIKAGAPATDFLSVLSGTLHVRTPSVLGEDILMRAVCPGEFAGVPLLFSPEKTNPYDIVAIENSEILTFNVELLHQQRNNPRFSPLFDYLGAHLCKELLAVQRKAMILSGMDIAERLRRYLAVKMQLVHSREIKIPGTSSDLANYLGVNRSALSRVMGKLFADGTIRYDRGTITILK